MPISGSSLGPYTLIREIGRGAFGVVWLGERRSDIATTQLALKLPTADEIDIDSLAREARVWVQASGHPNVIPIVEANFYDGQAVIVSEYAPDGSLLDWLERAGGKARSFQEAADLVSGILAGLKHLHSRPEPIIYRDLKPSNILLQGDSPRLDFGIGRLIKTSGQTSTTAGTLPYMAPEAFDGERSVQTDLWAVGVIFFQLITGGLPFPQSETTELVDAILNDEPEFPAEMPAAVVRFIAKALEKDPAQRYASAEEMQQELRLIHVPQVLPQKSHRATMVFAGFLILAGLLGGGYLAISRNGIRGPAMVVSPSGLKYVDLKVGDGATPRLGQVVQVNYIGWLANGKEFDNTYKEGRSPEFRLGPGLIPGWNEAILSMRVSGKRRVIIPPHLGYGPPGRPPMIPPNETLTFEIELLGVRQ